MENIKVDKKGFYNLIKCIYEKLYGPVTVECKKSDKKRYNKIDIDNDFYKCDMEECYLKDENNNKILLNRKPIKGEKLYGSFVVKKLENIDASYMSLDEISDLIEDNKEKYPLLEKVPSLISSLASSKIKYDQVLLLNDEMCNTISEYYFKYLSTINNEDNRLKKNLNNTKVLIRKKDSL